MEEEKSSNYNIINNPISNLINNGIKFDVLKIDSTIKKNNSYIEGDNKFEFCLDYNPEQESEHEPNTDFQKYISKIKTKSTEYLGILSKNLIKEGHGYNHFDNGDEYFGQWKSNKKEGYGIYYFKDNGGEGDSTIKQIYFGEFKDNIKSGEGVYFNIKNFSEEKKDNILIPIDFNVAIGQFDNDNFSKGLVYSMNGGRRKIYKGRISEGKKNDDKAEIYEDDNKIFFGTVENNIMIRGRIIIMNEGLKEAGYYFNKKQKDGDIEFDYNQDEQNDENYIKSLDELNDVLDNEKIKDLFVYVMKLREKINSPDNFEYIKNLNYDEDIINQLKNLYEKYLDLNF